MQAIIFANGQMTDPVDLDHLRETASIIIAADGGMKHCTSVGIQPDVIIGDLDSMTADQITGLQDQGVRILQYPTRKDETDLELALRFALAEKIDETTILGGLGARWDMTVANILLIANPEFSPMNIYLIDGTQVITLLKSGSRTTITGHVGDVVSLIPLAGDVHGITTQGLEYPLTDETLHFGATRGISNVLIEDHAEIFYKDGYLLCIVNTEH